MVLWCWGAALAADFVPIPGAVLRKSDRLEVKASQLVEGITGDRVLLIGREGATLVGADGDPIVRVEAPGIELADVSSRDRFVLVHDGGVTLYQAGRELGRLGVVGTLLDVAISPDGRFLALGTSMNLSVYDSVDGRTLWSADGETKDVAYDAEGWLYADRKGAVRQYATSNGAQKDKGGAQMPRPLGILSDGCLPVPGGRFCPSGEGGVGVQRPNGALWVLNAGQFDRWEPLPDNQISSIGAEVQGGSTAVAWVGLDLLVARRDGTLERRSPTGELLASPKIDDCVNCVPLSIGADAGGGFYAVTNDVWQRWHADGTPNGSPKRVSKALDVARLVDGRWVTLSTDGRARVGKKPGAGTPTKRVLNPRGVDAAGDAFAVWSDAGVTVYAADGTVKAQPDLGPDRKPVAVALSSDGSTVAVLDDRGTLHAYRTSDARAVFRVPAGIQGNHLAWAAGRGFLIAGGDPLRVFGAHDGKEVVRVEIAPDGEIASLAVAENGSLVVIHASDTAGQLLRKIDWASIGD